MNRSGKSELTRKPLVVVRIVWIDVAKFIGIYLMILGHLEPALSLAGHSTASIRWLYSFHMPLFFFLSGMTTKRCPFLETVRKSFYSLIIPYISLSGILWIWHILVHFSSAQNRLNELFVFPLFGIFLGVGYDTNFSYAVCGALWFLMALFWCKIIFSLILTFEYYKITQFLPSILFFIVAFFLNKTDRFIPFSIGSAFMIYPIFLLGNILAPYLMKLSEKKERKLLMGLFGILLLCFVYGGGYK